ncbi:LLM class flavin-dependent oxidoreductase [Amnibacterium setariae]|uniref:LLM class flavin-dependent oxidoreductase n=1 Tax=Amnibacterium setariae TaxID=2306585 RepID=A0A3A1U0Y4_9MICO|nr:LLM class flavin-dependent oxidoreductase [Amnibacterium setariae]RIX30524.1 LLM class flavin-dependent oxidoreductase [Amnibacterium setariae]
MTSLGTVFQPTFAPEALLDAARRAEAAGLDELWVWEDCFKESGIATMTAALAATERLRVGVGILPVPLRNVALTAMEIATIARLFPGRGRFGVGHGVLDWMGQAGARVPSPLTLLQEYVPALRRLLAGEEVTALGRYVRLDGVRLAWPPQDAVPVLVAGEGPKTLAATGAVGDGTVLVPGMTPERVRAAADAALAARRAAGREGAHEVVVSVFTDFGPGGAARMEPEFDAWGMQGDRRFAATGGDDEIEAVVRSLATAGATTVLLQSRSHEPDLPAFIDGAGRIRARLAG